MKVVKNNPIYLLTKGIAFGGSGAKRSEIPFSKYEKFDQEIGELYWTELDDILRSDRSR